MASASRAAAPRERASTRATRPAHRDRAEAVRLACPRMPRRRGRSRAPPSPWTRALQPAREAKGRGAILRGEGPSDLSRPRSEEHTSELQSPCNLVCRLLLEKKKNIQEHSH